MSRLPLDGPGGQARRAASGDGPESTCDPDRASRPVNTTRAANLELEAERHAHYKDNEYLLEELKRTRRKCYQLRKQMQTMHAAFDASETAALRAEKDAYKKALSDIAYRLDKDGAIELDALRRIVRVGLACRNIKPGRRRLIRNTKEAAV